MHFQVVESWVMLRAFYKFCSIYWNNKLLANINQCSLLLCYLKCIHFNMDPDINKWKSMVTQIALQYMLISMGHWKYFKIQIYLNFVIIFQLYWTVVQLVQLINLTQIHLILIIIHFTPHFNNPIFFYHLPFFQTRYIVT